MPPPKAAEVILTEEPAQGRTDYPIFTVTTYRNNQAEAVRYDMGTDIDGVTHGTSKSITYSPTFRALCSDVMQYLRSK